MRLSMMLEPQEGLSYAQILAVARRVQDRGLAGLYRSDHYTSVGGREGLASTDAWATLAALARETADISLGTLVSPVTFRSAGNLAKVVATVDELAGPAPDGTSRIHLGLGTGWLETEHRQHGFPFEDLDTRFQRLEEHLQAVHGLWDPDRDPYSQDGGHVRLDGAVFRPQPRPQPRIIIGGRGMRRTPGLAARYADELNAPFNDPDRCREQLRALRAACDEQGRDPDEVDYTVMTGCLVGADDTEVRRRGEQLMQTTGADGTYDEWLSSLRGTWVVGTPEEAADHLGRLADAGVDGVALQTQLPDELDMIDLVAEELRPRL